MYPRVNLWCAGWFGEINEDFDKIIYTLAREAASGENGMTVSPLINADRKGGAFPIMLQQFRRAIGISIIRGQAKLRLSRLHYVRETVAEAADVCKQNHSERRWNPNQSGHSSWFSEHCPEGYRDF